MKRYMTTAGGFLLRRRDVFDLDGDPIVHWEHVCQMTGKKLFRLYVVRLLNAAEPVTTFRRQQR